jgi:hypothetical protein
MPPWRAASAPAWPAPTPTPEPPRGHTPLCRVVARRILGVRFAWYSRKVERYSLHGFSVGACRCVAPADTSCVTGLPARTIDRSCRLFLSRPLAPFPGLPALGGISARFGRPPTCPAAVEFPLGSRWVPAPAHPGRAFPGPGPARPQFQAPSSLEPPMPRIYFLLTPAVNRASRLQSAIS